MVNVYIEPVPEGEGSGYTIKYAGGQSVDGVKHRKQETAIDLAKRAGHRPLVARIKNTDRGNPDHWRSA